MAYVPFNDELDKVTEREMVYDIVERLKIGRNLSLLPNSNYPAGTFLIDLIKNMIMMLPASFVLHAAGVKTAYIHIEKGARSGTTSYSDTKDLTILRAYSEQTQMDVKDCLSVSETTNGSTKTYIVSFSSDIAYLRDEYIKIYYY